MDHETKELIYNYAKKLFKSCSIDELWTVEVMTENEWKLNYDEERDQGIDYKTFISIVKACQTIKGNDDYCILSEESFFKVLQVLV